MSLLRLQQVSIDFGHGKLLEQASLVVEKGEHIALIGRNGEGKSTLLKLINGEISADEGNVQFGKDLQVQRLQQEVPEDLKGCIFDIVAQGLGKLGSQIITYQKLVDKADKTKEEVQLHHDLQQVLDNQNGWAALSQIEAMLSKMQLAPETKIEQLSGGLKRRVLLAQCLLTKPNLLLLDEPTNHLDIEAIEWLEQFLCQYSGAFILVTHDRAFLQRTANKIIEIDRGNIYSYDVGYEKYLELKDARLANEEKENQLFDKRLAQEEAWIRQGIKARRTRNEGRVRALKKMRVERAKRREQKGTMSLEMSTVERSGKMVLEANQLSFSYDKHPMVKDFSCLVTRGDKIGIVGPNGCGKTTLLKLLLKELTPDSGEVKHGTQLKLAYFNQMRTGFDEKKSAVDNIGGGSQTVEVFGEKKHIISYLEQFLFTPARSRTPIHYFSGGEKNRLYLARLFTQNANVLVLDEPTNDLDIETLEILEALLVQFSGTVLMVSHDRAFLDNVVTMSWVYQGQGIFEEFVGGYDDYQKFLKPQVVKEKTKIDNSAKENTTNAQALSYEERKELRSLPKKIETLEEKVAQLQQELASPEMYEQKNQAKFQTKTKLLEQTESSLEMLLVRWEELEEKNN